MAWSAWTRTRPIGRVLVPLTEEGRRRFGQALVLWRTAQDRVAEVLGELVADQLRDQLNGIAEDDQLTLRW